jgi:hypothetical protein
MQEKNQKIFSRNRFSTKLPVRLTWPAIFGVETLFRLPLADLKA